MSFRTWFDSLKPRRSLAPIQHARRDARRRQPASSRLALERLEDRCMLAAWFSVDDAYIVEGDQGNQQAAVVVSLSRPHGSSISVKYSTGNDTATAGSDYNAASGKLTFARGQTSKTILIPVKGDRLVESSEQFFVKLSHTNGAKIANRTAVVTIQDNEPRISISDPQAREASSGTTPLDFMVSLSNAYDKPVTVNYSTTDGSAIAGTDYNATSGSVVFAPGETTKTISVLVSGNQTPEANRTLSVNVSTPNSYAVISKGVGVGSIVDKEPRISIAGAYNYYGETSFNFIVSLSAAYDEDVTVNFATENGTAIADVVYAATSGALTFAPGETTKTISVAALDPTAVDKSFSVRLSGASINALITNELATGYSYYGYNDYYYGGDYGGYYYYDYYYYY